ncbi:hypothetical protein [Actinomadura latina]|uniref:Uncharacterized protein n=1 Tax=Actinomadura latina TaxID=163603 RepID=A0A846Z1T7_9ACTN|nr:hypothetical protein [Actinomadura latina]NKZ04715.1 hypothetical protein [Actinomadura latina]
MKSFSYTELDLLAGEVLPERAVLSTLLVGGGGDDDNHNFNLNAGHGGGDDDSTTIVQNSCVSTNNQQNAGLLSALGLASQNPTSTHSCLPGTAIANNG